MSRHFMFGSSNRLTHCRHDPGTPSAHRLKLSPPDLSTSGWVAAQPEAFRTAATSERRTTIPNAGKDPAEDRRSGKTANRSGMQDMLGHDTGDMLHTEMVGACLAGTAANPPFGGSLVRRSLSESCRSCRRNRVAGPDRIGRGAAPRPEAEGVNPPEVRLGPSQAVPAVPSRYLHR